MQWRSLVTSALLFLFYIPIAVGQAQPLDRRCLNGYVELQFRITDEHDRPVPFMVHVELLNSSSVPMQQRFVRSEGQTSFQVSSVGDYHVRVTGEDIQETNSETVTVSCGDRSKMTFVHVKPKEASGAAATGRENSGTMTSAAQLRIPQDARKYFDKGWKAYEDKNYPMAAEFFQQAITAYPEYDAAYNNLGVAYMKMDQTEKALAAFQAAVKLNDKDADADRNLSRMLIRTGEYKQAEEWVKKSLMVEPSDAGGLTLAAIAEFQTGEYAAAVQSARKVHQGPHDGFASCHYVAGQALERMHQLPAARTEYQLYLQEMPNGPEAVEIRAGLERIDDETANAQ